MTALSLYDVAECKGTVLIGSGFLDLAKFIDDHVGIEKVIDALPYSITEGEKSVTEVKEAISMREARFEHNVEHTPEVLKTEEEIANEVINHLVQQSEDYPDECKYIFKMYQSVNISNGALTEMNQAFLATHYENRDKLDDEGGEESSTEGDS